MKKILTATLFAAGFALASGSAMAAPAQSSSSAVLPNLSQPAQYGGGGYGGGGYGGGGYRSGGYGYQQSCRYVRRCEGYPPYQRCWRERVCG